MFLEISRCSWDSLHPDYTLQQTFAIVIYCTYVLIAGSIFPREFRGLESKQGRGSAHTQTSCQDRTGQLTGRCKHLQ